MVWLWRLGFILFLFFKQKTAYVVGISDWSTDVCSSDLVVTGVQISAYRDGAARLPHLLDALLAATSVCRFRLTSIAPWELDAGLLDRQIGSASVRERVCQYV